MIKNPHLIKKIITMTACVLFAASLAGASPVQEYKAGELLIKFKDNVRQDTLASAAQALGVTGVDQTTIQQALMAQYGDKVRDVSSRLGVERWHLSQPEKVMDIIAALNLSPLVAFAEPNYQRRTAALSNGPNDPDYQNGKQWWLASVEADRAYAEGVIPTSQEIIVAVVDSGMQTDHEDLVGQWIAGWNFVSDTDDVEDIDAHGHGTHVSGIIAAAAGNTLGIAGTICGGSIKLLPVKALENEVGYDSDIAEGIVWAADHGAKVLNLSFGSSFMGSTLADAVDYAYSKGCVLVAAAGNFAEYGNPLFYPAAYPSVIAVAATTQSGDWAVYSHYHDYIDLAAPGGFGYSENDPGKIWSTLNGSSDNYDYLMGTSMASPIVAGTAALLLAQNPDLTPDQVKNRLCMTATKTGSLVGDSDGWNPYLGWGMVNVYSALKLTTTYQTPKNGRASYNFPNPFQPARGEMTTITIPASKIGVEAQLQIFDAAGHKVVEKIIPGSDVYPGATTTWDGRDRQGNWVANGVYFYRLKVEDTVYENKMAVLNQ